jgi:hypothetical protein
VSIATGVGNRHTPRSSGTSPNTSRLDQRQSSQQQRSPTCTSIDRKHPIRRSPRSNYRLERRPSSRDIRAPAQADRLARVTCARVAFTDAGPVEGVTPRDACGISLRAARANGCRSWAVAAPRLFLGRSGLACRKRQPQKHGREHQEHHANAGRVTGEVNDGDDEEQQPRKGVAPCLSRHDLTIQAQPPRKLGGQSGTLTHAILPVGR